MGSALPSGIPPTVYSYDSSMSAVLCCSSQPLQQCTNDISVLTSVIAHATCVACIVLVELVLSMLTLQIAIYSSDGRSLRIRHIQK